MSTENEDKLRMVCDLMNGSKYKNIAQQFFQEKNILGDCRYVHSVSDPVSQMPASHTFQSENIGQHYYHAKVSRKTNSVTEWYRANVVLENNDSKWVALDISTGQPIEYYSFEVVDGVGIEKKFDSATNKHLVTNYFENFYAMTAEQQELIKDLPFKRTSYMWANKPGGFVVEFLPTYFSDVYEGINMANLHLLEV
jgi:hypothetical protein